MSYAKLFSSITESSLWCEADEVRILFVSMLAKADQTGFVEAALPGLARLANLSPDRVQAALEVLQAPDPHSKNPEHEGRRIMPVPGGWMLLNYEHYRQRTGDEERREYMREYMRDYRKRQTEGVNSVNIGVNNGKHRKHDVSKCKDFPSASASALTNKKEEEPEELPFTSDRFAALWAEWKIHRREINRPLKKTSALRQLKMLARIGEERAIAMIEHTIFKGWQGLREPDEKESQKRPQAVKGIGDDDG